MSQTWVPPQRVIYTLFISNPIFFSFILLLNLFQTQKIMRAPFAALLLLIYIANSKNWSDNSDLLCSTLSILHSIDHIPGISLDKTTPNRLLPFTRSWNLAPWTHSTSRRAATSRASTAETFIGRRIMRSTNALWPKSIRLKQIGLQIKGKSRKLRAMSEAIVMFLWGF